MIDYWSVEVDNLRTRKIIIEFIEKNKDKKIDFIKTTIYKLIKEGDVVLLQEANDDPIIIFK